MKEQALFITDLHLRPAHYDIATRVLNKAEEELDRHRPKYLIIGGDTFHYKNQTHASMTGLFYDFLKRVTKKCIVIVLIGNHDWAIPYTEHSLRTFEMPNLIIVDTTYRLNEKVGFIGYCREQSRFEELMQNLRGCEILFGHLDLNGFELGSGWEESDSFCGAERFVEFKKVFSGHFHKAQEKKLSSGTEIIYGGTGYTTDFNESDQIKRFLLIDLETGNWEPILTGLTLHKTIKIAATEEPPQFAEEDIKNGVNFRVIVSGTKDQIASFRVPKNYQAKIIFEIKSSESYRLDISAADNQEAMVQKYVQYKLKESFGSEADVDEERLMRLGKTLLGQASRGKS